MMETEHEPPTLPTEPPRVPLASMWISMLVPPFVTTIAGVAIGAVGRRQTPMNDLIILLPLLSAALILCFAFQFFSAVTKRYRGTSLAFLVCSYVIGEIIICLALWFGACVLAL